MKKTILFIAAVACLGLASCTDNNLEEIQKQENESYSVDKQKITIPGR